MKKLLLVAPLLLSFNLVSDVEAKGKNRKNNSGGGIISLPRCTKKRPCSRMPELPSPGRPGRNCTWKNPCSRMPELPFFPGEIQPMPRGGLR